MKARPLDSLARSCGIASEYRDVSDRLHVTADATKRRVLAAMGYAAETDEQAAASLESRATARWQRRLPPVATATVGEPSTALRMTLPDADRRRQLGWRLDDESATPVAEGRIMGASGGVTARRRVADGEWIATTLTVPLPRDAGYYRLVLEPRASPMGCLADCTVLVAPDRCFQPAIFDEQARFWGLSAQLYGVRSERNWGIGDFTDLLRLVELTADQGAAFVGLNPLHETQVGDYGAASPYNPSTRRFLNPLYIDVEAVPDLAECESAQTLVAEPAFQSRIRTLRGAELVDYEGVARAKLEVLERLFESFRVRHRNRGTERGRAFDRFRESRHDLDAHVAFEVLQERFRSEDPGVWGWPAWPEPFRDETAAAVARAVAERRDRADFFAYLQWNADAQLAAAQRRARELGMPIGIYTDLALSVRPGGADSWVDHGLHLEGLELGAPPDDFNPSGQSWGLPAWHPERLRETRYRPFIEVLRANMRSGGALRIDHVMSLMRCFLIPAGASPTEGAYLHYRFDEMLAVLALESQRNRCLVIGEDLGTVPKAVRRALRAVDALGYRVLYFERDDEGAFKPPSEFDRGALSVASTHDLPTLAGFWGGRDIEWRSELGLYASTEAREQQIIARAQDRAKLLVALEREGLAVEDAAGPETAGGPVMPVALRAAVHGYLGRSASVLVAVQAEDLLGEIEQANMPGTGSAHPNWRRRLGLAIEAWLDDPGARAILEAVRATGRAAGTARAPAEPGGFQAARRADIPRSTYRIQLHRGFGFADLTALVPYLDALGVSHCYCSPYLKARPGSEHGYDVIDHSKLNPEIGSDADFDRLCEALRAVGMGQILDVVPNHVAVMGRDNAWWLDVLENGPASQYAEFFDIDWQPRKESMRGKVLLPVLGDHYGNVLDRGELVLEFDAGAGRFAVSYYDNLFPIDPREYPLILQPDLDRLRNRLAENDSDLAVFESLITAFGNLPPRWRDDEESRRERRRDQSLHTERLAELVRQVPDIQDYIRECLRAFNGDKRYSTDTARLHDLLESQAYRLAYWRLASHEINYRRFFDINELASLRMELSEVFEATHAFVLDLVRRGRVQGLRIDHPDGLYDPRGYFEKLQHETGPAGQATDDPEKLPLYVLAEKILAGDESVRGDWPIHGTTGYDFANLATRFAIDPHGIAALDELYRAWTDRHDPYRDVLRNAKRLIMQTSLASELSVLAHELDRLAELDPHTRDFGLGGLHNALLEVIANFPVYRTYVVGSQVGAEDRALIDQAVDTAKDLSEAADTNVFEYLRDVLLQRSAVGRPAAIGERVARFGMRLQQYTSPVAAKGMEDTAFYRYGRLISLNDVGGTPDRPTATIEEVHAANAARLEHWPHSMLGSSSHDSKRSEDVRARIDVLSEMPAEWAERVWRWAELNEGAKRISQDGTQWPGPDMEYFFYQTLLGVWPLGGLSQASRDDFVARVEAYMIKAAREAKRRTSWINENPAYEAALRAFVGSVLDTEKNASFIADFEAFQSRVVRPGLYNSISQLALKLTCPGVPDIYQGNELWRFDLVDPDNRRPVDFAARSAMLAELQRSVSRQGGLETVQALLPTIEDGRLKLLLTWRLLELRRQHPQLFAEGTYEPLTVMGDKAAHVLAFRRRARGTTLVVAVLRWFSRLLDADNALLDMDRLGETRVEADASHRDWSNALTGRALAGERSGTGRGAGWTVGALCAGLPAAVLIGRDGS